MNRITFIINKNSARKQYNSIRKAIEDKFRKPDFDVDVHYTEYAGHAILLSEQAIDSGSNIIVAVGGDGTVNEVASPIIGSDVALGIVPMGSGNGLARHLGIPRNIEKALDLVARVNTSLIDTCIVNNKPFISIAGVGFDAHVADLFSKGTRRGFLGYFHIVANEFLNYIPQKYSLKFDDGTLIKTTALFIALANSNQFGYNTTIAPNATLVDGLMDVCIVRKPEIYRLPIIANLLLLRKLELSPLVKIIKAKEVTITRKNPGVVNIDGEAIKFKKKIRISLKPKSLQIIINPDVSKV